MATFFSDMTGSQLALTVTALLLAHYAGFIAYKFFVDPLRDIPGPWSTRITRLWLLGEIDSGHSHMTFHRLHEKYGPVVRVTRNLYSFNSPEDQKKIYDLKGKMAKTAYYDTGGNPGEPNLFTTRDEADHADRRKRIAALYTMSSMVHYEDAVDRMNAVLVRKFTEFAKQQELVSIPSFMQYYSFDVIGEITIDHSFGMMEANSDVDGLCKLTHIGAMYQGHVGILPEIHPPFHFLRWLLGYQNEGTALDEIVATQLQKHRKALHSKPGDPKSESFITKLLKLEKAGKVEQKHIFDAIGANIIAGSDTTGITLSAALYYLYRTPHALTALRKEIDGSNASDPVTWKEAQNMPYLQAVIQETLRIHSAAAYILERTVPEGGVELAGRWFPEGTNVGCQSWALHRNKAIYGDDADSFRPERFLDTTNPSNTAKLAQSFAFGAGTRTCIGKNISLLEMTKVIPQIVRKFDLVFQKDPMTGMEKEWELYTSWFVFQRFWCYVRLREE